MERRYEKVWMSAAHHTDSEGTSKSLNDFPDIDLRASICICLVCQSSCYTACSLSSYEASSFEVAPFLQLHLSLLLASVNHLSLHGHRDMKPEHFFPTRGLIQDNSHTKLHPHICWLHPPTVWSLQAPSRHWEQLHLWELKLQYPALRPTFSCSLTLPIIAASWLSFLTCPGHSPGLAP